MAALTAFYDLEHGPVSYDFSVFLVKAMKERDDRKATGLHVVIVPKEDGLGGFARHWGNHDEAATRWRLWHILVACCPLAGATLTICSSRAQANRLRGNGYWWPEGKSHFMSPLIDAARLGSKIPQLRATDAARRYVMQWLKGREVVTTTIRHQSTDGDRNSNRPEWDKIVQWLKAKGHDVIQVDESNIALGEGRGYAELDPDLRLALYELAKMNLICANGPSALMYLSRAPYLIFGLGLNAGWREHYKRYFHMDVGDQLPWAGPRQKMVYRPDNFDVMREEFEALR